MKADQATKEGHGVFDIRDFFFRTLQLVKMYISLAGVPRGASNVNMSKPSFTSIKKGNRELTLSPREVR
jgi:hypothetical protein